MTNIDPYLAIYFITFVVMILLQVPVGYAMCASAFEFILFNHQSFVMFAQRTANSLADFNMLALPAFLFVGCFMNEVGLTDRIFYLAEKWIGHLTGGLAHANIAVSFPRESQILANKLLVAGVDTVLDGQQARAHFRIQL